MTLLEYINSGATDIPTLSKALGVSEHAIRKWIYGQREPSLEMAHTIIEISGGQVELDALTKGSARKAVAEKREAA